MGRSDRGDPRQVSHGAPISTASAAARATVACAEISGLTQRVFRRLDFQRLEQMGNLEKAYLNLATSFLGKFFQNH
jgi:hypothetical protein